MKGTKILIFVFAIWLTLVTTQAKPKEGKNSEVINVKNGVKRIIINISNKHEMECENKSHPPGVKNSENVPYSDNSNNNEMGLNQHNTIPTKLNMQNLTLG